MNMRHFTYGEKETAYLCSKDEKLARAISELGHLRRPVNHDRFTALVDSIIGQQISTKAHQTIRERMSTGIGQITPEAILSLSEEELQAYGMTFRKAGYIRTASERVLSGELDIASFPDKTDAEIIAELSALPGVGVWTAEMLLLHSLERPDILSYGDLAILRGMRMLYHHRQITRKLFEKYRRRYSPFGSVASIYLWAISAGRIDGLKDYGCFRHQSSGKIP